MKPILKLIAAGLFLAAGPAKALTTSPGAFRLEDSARGNVLLGAETAEIDSGEVYGHIVLLWGNLVVRGQVKEITVLSGNVIFHPGAKVTDSLAIIGGAFESLPGADVPPEKVSYRSAGPLWSALASAAKIWRENISWVLQAIALVIGVLSLWVIGFLLFRFFPALQGITAGRLQREWPQNLVVALLGTFVVPVFTVLLVISIFGILLLPFYFLFLALAALIAYLGAAVWAGHRLLPPRPGESLRPFAFLLGLSLLQGLWLLGFWGAIVALLLWTLAWGGLLRGARALWK